MKPFTLRSLLLAALLSMSQPLSATGTAIQANFLRDYLICPGCLVCLIPDNIQGLPVEDRNLHYRIGTTIFILGNAALSAIAAAYNSKADKQIPGYTELAPRSGFYFSIPLEIVSAMTLTLAAVFSPTNQKGPVLSSMFALVGMSLAVSGMAASIAGRNEMQNTHGYTTEDQRVAFGIAIANGIWSIASLFIHPISLWIHLRREDGLSPA